jgi:hypothetical protein
MSQPQDQAQDQPRPPAPFRFLDLPAELRIMVYERLSPVTRHHSFSHPVADQDEERPKVRDSKVTLVVESVPTAILATCKLLHGEAKPYLKRIPERLQTEPMRLMIDTASFAPLFSYNEFFRPAIRHCLKQHRKGNASPLINEGMMRLFISKSGTQLHDGVLVRQLRRFIEECALFMIHRSPATSIVAITRHPACNLRKFTWQFSLTTRGTRHAAKWHYGGWKLFPGPVGSCCGRR